MKQNAPQFNYVHALPPEILFSVFEQLFLDVTPVFRESRPDLFARHAAPSLCLPLLAVCRRWRCVAIGHAVLWRRIRILSPTRLGLVEFALQHSRGLQLELSINVADEQAIHSVVSLLLPHIGRIRTLQVFIPARSISNIDILLTTRMLVLERLFIIGGYGLLSTPRASLDVAPGQYPALRSLSAEIVHVPWYAHAFSALERLDLGECWIESHSSSLSHVLDILAVCTRLVHLTIQGSLPYDRDSAVDRHRVVAMRNLRELHIQDSAHQLLPLLSHLHLPVETDMFVLTTADFAGNPKARANLRDMVPDDPRCMPILGDAVSVHFEKENEIITIHGSSGGKLVLMLPLDDNFMNTEPEHGFHYEGDFDGRVSRDLWERTFRTFDGIEEVSVFGYGDARMLEFALALGGESAGESPGLHAPLLPHLRKVNLHGANAQEAYDQLDWGFKSGDNDGRKVDIHFSSVAVAPTGGWVGKASQEELRCFT
ncbi:hypothetical protein K466DRAFT_602193 [Polyporus arcularius HHB13444]|uniref:Uncharacterized protein n=1 Tax=Polyporus arcularius HHB13444 TaxID=1314778 RepID=A0A5C3P3H6_9APHY|nr:hypothetical protein K466DRAFT_602193 [Polyporus arcularius HHB13444]